jgi:hypothetical protein
MAAFEKPDCDGHLSDRATAAAEGRPVAERRVGIHANTLPGRKQEVPTTDEF